MKCLVIFTLHKILLGRSNQGGLDVCGMRGGDEKGVSLKQCKAQAREAQRCPLKSGIHLLQTSGGG
jgi:hypothetical protein